MLLLNEHSKANNIYEDPFLHFKFDLIRLWEIDPAPIFSSKLWELFPLIPLMKADSDIILNAEKEIYHSELTVDRKSDLLTMLLIYTCLKNSEIAQKLWLNRRDIMVQSPVYDWIRAEGKQEGKQEGEYIKARSDA